MRHACSHNSQANLVFEPNIQQPVLSNYQKLTASSRLNVCRVIHGKEEPSFAENASRS